MLQPTEKQFTITIDEIGTFTFKFPTLINDLEADAAASKLLAGNDTPTVVAGNIATMMGTLSAVIVEKPDSFDLKNIYSYEELEAVYNVFTEKVSSFRNQAAVTKQPGDKKTGTGEG